MMREGRATEAGTARFAFRWKATLAADHFKKSAGLWLSSLGIGTYLGDPTPADDQGYRQSVVAAVRGGCNVIDTAINYRLQRSERSIGAALGDLLDGSGANPANISRDELVIATKGGFIPMDGDDPRDARAWFAATLEKPGIATAADVVAGCHVMTPRYLSAQIDWSRRNLGLATLDIYYVHNPETQLQEIRRTEFLDRIRAAFALLEEKVAAGAIGVYGVATWDGLRVPSSTLSHLSLAELLAAAREVGGDGHHFGAVQLPVNLVMGEACLDKTQRSADGREVSLLEAAQEAGVIVMASGSLLQGRLISALPPALAARLPGTETGAQRGLQVVRSIGGVACALVGMKSPTHVGENLAVARVPRLEPPVAATLLSECRPR